MTASYDPGTNLVVGGSFLERGDFGPNQRQATVRFFTELAGNYGNLSFEDRQAVENYFAEVVERIEAGRMQPSRTWNDVHLKSRVRVMYTNYGDGTALYLNVPYRAR